MKWCDPTVPIDERVDDMVSRMTLAEKIPNLDSGAPGIPSLGLNGYNWLVLTVLRLPAYLHARVPVRNQPRRGGARHPTLTWRVVLAFVMRICGTQVVRSVDWRCIRPRHPDDQVCIPDHDRDEFQPDALAADRPADRQGGQGDDERRQRLQHLLGTGHQPRPRAPVGPCVPLLRALALMVNVRRSQLRTHSIRQSDVQLLN